MTLPRRDKRSGQDPGVTGTGNAGTYVSVQSSASGTVGRVPSANPPAWAIHTNMGHSYGIDFLNKNTEVEIMFGLVKKSWEI